MSSFHCRASSLRRAGLLLTLLAGVLQQATTHTAPQGAPSTSPPTPTFRSAVKLIDIDVFVTDKDGHFVKNLTKEDFEIVEDGKAQELQAFSFVDIPVESSTTERRVTATEPDVVANTASQGRLYVIVMDSPSTYSAPQWVAGNTYNELAQRVAERFIDDFVEPGDLVAVVHAHGTFSDSQTFTASKALLRASIEKYGRGLSGDTADLLPPEMIQRHIDSYRAIEDVARQLGAVTGRRKAILWIGAQLRYEAPVCPPERPLNTLPCQLQTRWSTILGAHHDAIVAATRNNVAVYAIDPAGLTTEMGQAEMDRRSALQVVAEDTGGLSVIGTNNFAAGFQNIVRDNSTYYVLGYAPAKEYRDGKFHGVQVRVKRPGLFTVRSRKGYTAPASDSRTAPTPALPEGVSVAARDALRMPLPVRGLNVSLFSASFRGTDRDQSVVIGGQISGDLRLDGKQDVALSYQVFTQDNHVQTGEHKTFAIDLQPETRARVAATGLHFVDRIQLPPGQYEIRYVVDQPGGALGSVVAPLVVPKFDEPLALSGVLLASADTAARLMLRNDAELADQLRGNPTSVRTFSTDDLVNAYAEVYSNDDRLSADDVTVTGILTTTDGKEIAREQGSRRAPEPARGRWGFLVEFELADVPAGNYTLTIEASSTRRKEPIRRSLPIVVEK